MRQIKGFQVSGQGLYVLTEDGVLWCRKGDDWEAVTPPGDDDPFKPKQTQDRILKRLQRGQGFPKEST